MEIAIECSLESLFALFESSSISTGMTHQAPGGAILRLGNMPMEKRGEPQIYATLVTVLVSIGSGVAINLFASWLYDKLKGNGQGRRMIRIDRKLVEVSHEEITRVLSETVEIEEHK